MGSQLDFGLPGAKPPTGPESGTKKAPSSEGAPCLPLCLYRAIQESDFFLYLNDRGNRRFIPMVCYSVTGCRTCLKSLKPKLDLGELYHAKKVRKNEKP